MGLEPRAGGEEPGSGSRTPRAHSHAQGGGRRPLRTLGPGGSRAGPSRNAISWLWALQPPFIISELEILTGNKAVNRAVAAVSSGPAAWNADQASCRLPRAHSPGGERAHMWGRLGPSVCRHSRGLGSAPAGGHSGAPSLSALQSLVGWSLQHT